MHPKGTSADFVLGRHGLQSKPRNDRAGERIPPRACGLVGMTGERGRLARTERGVEGAAPYGLGMTGGEGIGRRMTEK